MLMDRIKQVCQQLLKRFENNDLPALVAAELIKRRPDDRRPSDCWSLGNRIIMLIHGTDDARGFRQWEQVGRHVKKGAKAFYIFAPVKKKIVKKETDPETGEEKTVETYITRGFKEIPVFRYEDTEGKPLPERDYRPRELPPLFELAQRLCEVDYRPGQIPGLNGMTDGQKITLFTHDPGTFFHELAHVVDGKLNGGLKPGQHLDQEAVAEFSAAVLCEMYGFKHRAAYTWKYVRHYAGDPDKALKVIMSLLGRVEAVVNFLLDGQKNLLQVA